MIRYDFLQGSQEWINVRLGIPTASRFSDILTPAKWELSKSAIGYRHELCAEWILGNPVKPFKHAWTDRGSNLEQEGLDAYAFEKNTPVEQVGFITLDDGRAGASPDALVVGVAGGVENKTLSAVNHVAALLGEADKYTMQIAGQMWIGELEWVDRVYFNPAMPLVIQRVERDDALIDKLAGAVLEFCDRLDEMKSRLIGLGCKPIPPPTGNKPLPDDRPTEAELRELGDEFFGEPLPTPDFGPTEDRILQVATGPLSRPKMAVWV